MKLNKIAEIPNIVDENAPVPTRTPSPQAFQPQPDFVAQAASDFIQANTISDNPFEDIALRERGVRRVSENTKIGIFSMVPYVLRKMIEMNRMKKKL